MKIRERLLYDCPGAESVAEVFDRAHSGWPSSWPAKLVGAPGQPLRERLLPGDLLLRRALGEGRLVTIDVVRSDALDPHHSLDESYDAPTGAGGFAQVVSVGLGPEEHYSERARRVVDTRGYVPEDQAVLRLPTEHVTSGATTLRPGRVGNAVNGTGTGGAHIAIVSPSGALPGTSTAASVTTTVAGLTPNFVTAFSSNGGHTVTFDFAPGHPTAKFNDPNAHYDFAGTDTQRMDSLRWGLFDNATQAAIATRGGHGATRLLDELQAAVIVRRAFASVPFVGRPIQPKRIVGYSDFTAILLSVYSLLGWASLHGPMLNSSSTATRNLLAKCMTLPPGGVWTGNVVQDNLNLVGTRPTASIRGVLLGGNLSLVDALYASPMLPSLKDAILFIEEVDESGRKIDRMIEGLKHRGAARQVKAVVVGRCSNINSQTVATLVNNSWGVPCVSGLTAGHSGTNNPLWIGLEHELEFPSPGNPRLLIRP